jgi:hypothetical protein
MRYGQKLREPHEAAGGSEVDRRSERLAYVAALNPTGGTLNDAMLVIDVDPASANYGKRVGSFFLFSKDKLYSM